MTVCLASSNQDIRCMHCRKGLERSNVPNDNLVALDGTLHLHCVTAQGSLINKWLHVSMGKRDRTHVETADRKPFFHQLSRHAAAHCAQSNESDAAIAARLRHRTWRSKESSTW